MIFFVVLKTVLVVVKTDLVCWTAFENSSGAAKPRKISFQNNNQQNAASYQIEKSYWISSRG